MIITICRDIKYSNYYMRLLFTECIIRNDVGHLDLLVKRQDINETKAAIRAKLSGLPDK